MPVPPKHTERDRLIALAALYQAVSCVQAIARHGQVDTAAMEPCIYSLFQLDPPNVLAVYGQAIAVQRGAERLLEQLTGPARDLELTRYAITLIKHAHHLSMRRDLLTLLRTDIERIAALCRQQSLVDDERLAQLATLYTNTVGQLEPRISVHGQPLYLKQTVHQQQVRALLLAGIRAAILWQQLGGRRWHIILARRRLFDAVTSYLADYAPAADDDTPPASD